MNKTDEFYFLQPEPNRGCFLALREIILGLNENIIETIKYGSPCFLFKTKLFCYLWLDKKTKEPYILFVKGKEIDHPSLEAGNRVKMKILRIKPDEDLDLDLLHEVLNIALQLYP